MNSKLVNNQILISQLKLLNIFEIDFTINLIID